MKRKTILITLCMLWVLTQIGATTYFVNSVTGYDSNDGLSQQTAIKTITKVNQLKVNAGDKILLAKGQTFSGTLSWLNVSGTAKNEIYIGSYSPKGETSKELPIIDAKGFRNGIILSNCSYIRVEGLVITANGGVPNRKSIKNDMRCGVLVNTTKEGSYKNIVLSNLVIKDVFYAAKGVSRSKKETNSANGTQAYGWGIRFINRTKGAILENMQVNGCEVRNVGHTGIKITALKHSVTDLKLYNNKVNHTGGPGIQMSGVLNGHVKGNAVTHSGSTTDSRKWGRGSGLWTWGCSKVIIEHNEFRNSNGPADSAGCHIDFNCDNVIVQFCISENNAGGFCEILGNNYNCAYRYNVSINDGHRVKKKGVAFQEGKIFWLSGFNGKGKNHNGPFNSYFYNNTIYVNSDIEAKMAVTRTAQGALLANNIFYIEGESKLVLGDQYKPATEGESMIKNVIFKNNLFLKAANWPKDVLIQDETPVFGNPVFKNPNGNQAKDFQPSNKALIKNKGIKITTIPEDTVGIYIGLEVEKDILGNSIKGLPDMGAIELK